MSGFGSDPVPCRPCVLRPERAVLRVQGAAQAAAFPLDQVRLVVGRSAPPLLSVDIDLRPFDQAQPPTVSRRHAELRWVDGRLEVLDLGSRNGTRVNGEPVPALHPARPCQARTLAAGDHIAFGGVEVEILEEAACPEMS